MFQDIVHMQNLFTSGWPTTTISDNSFVDGNQGAAWNYGASATNDMGGISATMTDKAMASHTVGSFGVTDTAYSGEAAYDGTASVTAYAMNSNINIDAGNVASTTGHGVNSTTTVIG
ncbi:hypothetical protein T484DRAFT_1930103 [Baffinella frigidus]|nr:hypothetical protein T484DRAFT_1930103 [Cryptophyta sp. CCMP2293]|eukprot:CAMPEP_0180137446 /NCGR_PEP_ID=MMETSP0986-20121125/12216_1 /TAXON_ID=697907 /ORGANISM="non described non described, Strain CCMP2293" /LENGTH=116 /DNA_ID=CAMNT_0022078907 /DNA_START=115 /DNA_END=465 /DNA_ORIENTATION=-